MPLPTYSTTRTDYPAPLEGQDVTGGTFGPAGRAAADEALMSGLGTSLIAHTFSGGPQVSHDDAAKELKAEGLDASVLPKDSISSGYLGAIKQQQIRIQEDRDLQNRATQISSFGRTVAGFGGAAADPLFLGIGAVTGGFGIGARGAGLIVRSATGAAEGAGAMTAYDIGRKELGTAQGDPDINSAQILHDAAWGGAAGGLLKGAFGPRAVEPGGAKYLPMIETAEATASYAARKGIPENEVVSSAGAVGKYQVTPGTARQYGFEPERLSDPEYNRKAATAILDDLHKRFGDDPEAIAVGYNAGPGVARRFVHAGYDRSMLPQETRDYLARIDRSGVGNGRAQFGLRPETQQAAAESAVAQAATDADVDVKPVLDQDESFRTNPAKIAMEHEADVSRILSEGAQAAVPKPGSIFTDDPDAAALSKRIEREHTVRSGGEDLRLVHLGGAGENPELADLHKMTGDAVQEAEQAHALAHPGTEEGEESPLHTALAADDDAIKNDSDLAKAIDAAVRCATVKGLA